VEREEVGRIGLGTWQTFDALDRVLPLFVQFGGRLVDSSPMYGRAESVLGDVAVRHRLRDRLFVATKVWTRGRAAGVAQMEDSERKLRGRIDLMQVHNLVDADTHLATLREWKRAGRIRSIGVTHYTASALARSRVLPAARWRRLRAGELLGRRARSRAQYPAARPANGH